MVRVTVEALPDDVLRAAGVPASDATPLRGWSVARTQADGNCLFDAISIALRNPSSLSQATAHAHATAQTLRLLVADSVVVPGNDMACAAVGHWVATRDASNGAEHDHVQNVDPADATSSGSLAAVSRAMRKKAAYWGEEYALRFLSAALQCTLLVLAVRDGSTSASTFAHHALGSKAPGVALLLSDADTTSAHYSVVLHGRAGLHSSAEIAPWTALASS